MKERPDRPGAAALREPWDDTGRQRLASLAGIWLFTASEILFFGGIFVGYAANFYRWPEGFRAGGEETELLFGLVNTIILLFSSALASIAATSARWPSLGRFSRACLWGAALLGLGFLVVKGLEYRQDILSGLVPGPGFPIPVPGAEIFFGFYWTATVLHALHLTIGIGLIARLALAGRSDPAWYSQTPAVAVTTLYWGLVDVIWTIVFVLIYLPGRAS